MRREDIKLRRAAREGDAQAMLALGKRYLLGSGVPRHVGMGLQYLLPHRKIPEAAVLVVQCLSLDELIDHGQVDILSTYAGKDPQLCAKLGVWRILQGRSEEGIDLLQESTPNGLYLKQLWEELPEPQRLATLLQNLSSLSAVDGRAIALACAKRAHSEADLGRLSLMLRIAIELHASAFLTREWIYKAVTLSIEQGEPLRHLGAQETQAALEFEAARSEPRAWLVLGLALCGLPCGPNPSSALVTRENLRKGTALLVRAADAGYNEAWLRLYKLNSNPRCSVANPEMARFCLEKAAAAGQAEAQRRLGAIVLREASTVTAMEQAVAWLHMAATQEDEHARDLLRSLVLPVDGDALEAEAALLDIGKIDPWLEARLRLAREFGLTKQEAMSIDPVAGERSWGLVTTVIPYLSHSKLSAPRVVPAVTPPAASALRHAVSLFSRTSVHELDAPQRAKSQQRRLTQFGFDEALFFAEANSVERDRVRVGTRWAHHARDHLRAALA